MKYLNILISIISFVAILLILIATKMIFIVIGAIIVPVAIAIFISFLIFSFLEEKRNDKSIDSKYIQNDFLKRYCDKK